MIVPSTGLAIISRPLSSRLRFRSDSWQRRADKLQQLLHRRGARRFVLLSITCQLCFGVNQLLFTLRQLLLRLCERGVAYQLSLVIIIRRDGVAPWLHWDGLPRSSVYCVSLRELANLFAGVTLCTLRFVRWWRAFYSNCMDHVGSVSPTLTVRCYKPHVQTTKRSVRWLLAVALSCSVLGVSGTGCGGCGSAK